MITEAAVWLIRDKSGREVNASCRMTASWRRALEADGHTVHGPIFVKLPAPTAAARVDVGAEQKPETD